MPIRKVGEITSKASPKQPVPAEEMWHRMESLGWLRQNAPWIEVTLFSGMGAIRSQVRATRFLRAENQILLEGVHATIQMPFPAAAEQILEIEQPQSRYSHEFWFCWPDQTVWILGQMKKRPKHHEKLVGYSTGLTEVKGKTFGQGESVILDDYRFIGCQFNECEVQYLGGEVAFEDCLFNSPYLVMADEAANTVEVLNALNAFTSGKFSVQGVQ